jgi:NhaP-type Na+/H+ or K+/H+ antiporter
MLTWFTFGTLLFLHPFENLDERVVVYAITSLTVVRMLPVFVSVAGLRLRTDTKLFIGWFGPRGLASIVFAVMVLNSHLPGGDVLVATTAWTIVLSILAHGLSANPLARIYGERVGSATI